MIAPASNVDSAVVGRGFATVPPARVPSSETFSDGESADGCPESRAKIGAKASTTVRRMRVGVLASGSGTILRALVERGLPVAVVVVDRPCGAMQIATDAGVAVELVERTTFGPDFDRVAYTHDVIDALQRHDVDLVAIAGFGTILSKPFVDAFGGRAVNTHPSLLPAFKGWHAVRDALEHGVKVTGCTVHLVTAEVDDGPILAQEAVPVLDDDTEATLHERIKEVERTLYPDVIERLAASNEDHDQARAGVGVRQDRTSPSSRAGSPTSASSWCRRRAPRRRSRRRACR